MDLNQLRKAISDSAELEYLFESDQWLPAVVSLFQDSNVPSQRTITLQLLRHPRSHSGVIPLNENDLKYRLRLKGSN